MYICGKTVRFKEDADGLHVRAVINHSQQEAVTNVSVLRILEEDTVFSQKVIIYATVNDFKDDFPVK